MPPIVFYDSLCSGDQRSALPRGKIRFLILGEYRKQEHRNIFTREKENDPRSSSFTAAEASKPHLPNSATHRRARSRIRGDNTHDLILLVL